MIKVFYYDSPDGRRAKLTAYEKDNQQYARLIIRADKGQGAVMLCKKYTTRAGAKAALNRRGSCWQCFKTTKY